MFQVPRPQRIAASLSRVLRPLCGLLCLLSVLAVGPALADEAQPPSVDATESTEAMDFELDHSLIQATVIQLEAHTKLRADRIIRDSTQRMMERLYRLNDEKMRTANRLARGLNPNPGRSTTRSPAKALAMLEKPQPEKP